MSRADRSGPNSLVEQGYQPLTARTHTSPAAAASTPSHPSPPAAAHNIDRNILRGMNWLMHHVEYNYSKLNERVLRDQEEVKERRKLEMKRIREKVEKEKEERERAAAAAAAAATSS